MSDDKITLHRVRFLDVMLVIVTKGFWILVIYWLNGIEVAAPDDAA